MENLSDVTSFEVVNANISKDHILNNEEDRNVLNEADTPNEGDKEIALGEDDAPNEGDKEIALGEDNVTHKECQKSLIDINIPVNEMHRDVIIENDKNIDKSCTLEYEKDNAVFEELSNRKQIDREAVDEDNISIKENNESIIGDGIFPILNVDDIRVTSDNELAFQRGILEEDISNEQSLHSKPGIFDTSSMSDPPSPIDDAQVIQESEIEFRSTKKDLTLPYFQLPKPDLDEFLFETEKNLQIHIQADENELSKHGDSSTSEFEFKKSTTVSLKPPPGVQNKFFDPKKTFITLDLSPDSQYDYSRQEKNISKSSHEVSRNSVNNEYKKVLSSLINVDESKSPGFKRLALKEFLKKQIDQKRYEAFNQSKILNIEDEEMEDILAERDEECFEIGDEGDSSDEYEEATVSFEINNTKVDDSESRNESAVNIHEEIHLDDKSSDNESDEDFIGVRKTKKKFLVLDEDSCDNEDFLNEEKRNCYSLGIEGPSSSELKIPEVIKNESDEKSNDKMNLNECDAKTLNRDTELCKNRGSVYGEDNSALSQISSSIPSYQPGGGFLNQEHRHENSSDSIASCTPSQQSIHDNVNEEGEDLNMHYQPEEDFMRSSRTQVLGNANGGSNTFGVKFDDLPVTQTENDSEIFLSKELADVCSGAFYKIRSVPEKKLDLKYMSEEKVTDFFDDEAELSGEDDGVDDKDDSDCGEGYNHDLYPSDEEDLPAAEVLREEIADLHMKRIMDEDEERIKEIQEKFLDDGELNNDGTGRSRRFAWINNDVEVPGVGNNSDSESDTDFVDDTSMSINQEKAKWRQENKEEEKDDLTEELNSSGYRRRSFLKVDIIGKPKFSHEEDPTRRLSYKRPRGSFLNLDNSSASQVLKKLKASEDSFGGSRTTKHFVFRNDLHESSAFVKEVPMKSVSIDPADICGSSKIRSIFNKI